MAKNGRIKSIGTAPAPAGANVIDLSTAYVLPGLFDAHTHMAMTTVASRDHGNFFFTSLLEPMASRAIQGATNLRSMLESGFTTIRDLGNAGNYADTAPRRAIEDGWTVEEAGRAGPGLKVAAHVETEAGAINAARAGVATIEHGFTLKDETLALMKERNASS